MRGVTLGLTSKPVDSDDRKRSKEVANGVLPVRYGRRVKLDLRTLIRVAILVLIIVVILKLLKVI